MTNTQCKNLCLSLLKADSEAEVISILTASGFWDDDGVWRYYGDIENNYSEIGNQASRFDVAIVEKLINSVDARLMNECLQRGMDPASSKAPASIREAVATYFDPETKGSGTAGRVSEWPAAKRTEVARNITFAATGVLPAAGNPCFTIADNGEGQTPRMMPRTLLSLPAGGSIKLRIPFVQGKFNMGGSGALRFCGKNNIQLLISRRNPRIVEHQGQSDATDSDWGFTIVRREDPIGSRRSSVYRYLAPMRADSLYGLGEVMSFESISFPLFPEANVPYARDAEWGTLIKLYEYNTPAGAKSHILRKDGLMSRLELLLPEAALPIRLHECRKYGGHKGSYDTTLAGVAVRLQDDKKDNLEFESSCTLSIDGQPLIATIYAFKKGKAETYRKTEGVLFTLNGQTHGHFPLDFFRRKAVGLGYIADSLLVVVDCSQMSRRAHEELFMNSRDRLATGDLRSEIENELEDILKHHEGLRALKEQRRREETEAKLEESKPLADMLQAMLKKHQALASLLLPGQRLSNPFKTQKAKADVDEFQGKPHPSFFKFQDREYGITFARECAVNSRCRE